MRWLRALALMACAGLLMACGARGTSGLHPAKEDFSQNPGGGQQTSTPSPVDKSFPVDLEGTGKPDKVTGAINQWATTLRVTNGDGKVLLDLAWDTRRFARVVGIGAATPALWVSDEGRLDGSSNLVYLFDPVKGEMAALTWNNPTPYGWEKERPTELRAQCTGRDTLREMQCTFPLDDLAKHKVLVTFRYDLGRMAGTRTGASLMFGTLAHEPAAPEELFKMFFTAVALRVEGEVPGYFVRPEDGRKVYATAQGVPVDQTPEIALQVKATNTYMFTARWPKGPPTTGTAVVTSVKGQWRFDSLQWSA